MWWSLLAGVAVAGTGDPTFDRWEGRPHCFPLSIGVQALAELERLDGRPVFLEELSTCGGDRPAGAPVVLPPEGAHGRPALRALVKAQAGASGVRYAIEKRAGGWLVAPVGVERMVDRQLGFDGERLRGLYELRSEMPRLPPLEVGCARYPMNELEVVPFADQPLLEGLVAVFAGLDPAPVGFALKRRPDPADAEGPPRGLLVPLHLEGSRPMPERGPEPPRPSCSPLTAAIRTLVRDDRLDGRPVFVEERSLCTQQRPAGVAVVEPPPAAVGREALQAVVDAHAQVAASVARYEVVERAGGWLIAPVGVDRVWDVPVSLDPSGAGDLASAVRALGHQVTARHGIGFLPPLDNPFGYEPCDWGGARAVSFDERPLLEGMVVLFRSWEYAPTGFALVQAPNLVDPERGRARVALSILSPQGP